MNFGKGMHRGLARRGQFRVVPVPDPLRDSREFELSFVSPGTATFHANCRVKSCSPLAIGVNYELRITSYELRNEAA
jgi:hypothetical protein